MESPAAPRAPDIESAARALSVLFPAPPACGFILGSGFGVIPTSLKASGGVPYASLAGFPAPTVEGHAGAVFALESLSGRIALFSGRYHLYEDTVRNAVGLPVRVLAALGARRVVLTCAAGGVAREFLPGDLVIVSDHINLTGWNPLQEIPFAQRRPRFMDVSRCYDAGLSEDLAKAAARHGARTHRGVLACVGGAAFETPAEARMLRYLGADAVAMSTVHEAILARYLGMTVAAVAIIANRAAGEDGQDVRHEAILETVENTVSERLGLFGDMMEIAASVSVG